MIAAAVLLITLPLMLVAALGDQADLARGPVFFAQERIGRGERPFRLYKFRTMAEDAEEREAELRWESSIPPGSCWSATRGSPGWGASCARPASTSCPQLVNVLKGDMSLVGPRPMPPAVDEQIDGWGRRRLDLTPGITGLWQVLGRTSIPFEEMIGLDYLYVTNWSLWQDIRLLVRTLPAITGGRGAN